MLSANVDLSENIVKTLIEEHYGIDVYSMKKIRAVYKVNTSHGSFGFKGAEELPDLPLIAEYLKKIREKGFIKIPKLLRSKEGKYLIHFEDKDYFMEEWLELQELPNHSYPYVQLIGEALADFHQATVGIRPEQDSPRYEWGKRPSFLFRAYQKLTKMKEKFLYQSSHSLEVKILDFLLERCSLAYQYIKNVDYNKLLSSHPESAALCHGGLQHRNIMLDHKGEVWFIDFETLSYAERVKDLAHFLEHHAKPYDWDSNMVFTFLHGYQSKLSTPINDMEWRIFFSYLAFPTRFYRRSIRYLTNNSNPEKYLKLKEIIDSETEKEPLFLLFNLPPKKVSHF
ncbi:phosphotransferase [Tepidibacillus fermentans]|uniref:CotS family spore coat protein n=1 Tax=Tepidibacillus fermentans TaxID=1281767 RepID=A0A4R3KGX1_9BACI|nr:phosphotransferase [Tepidibacillus fermentans]TCS82500.1 CotS family spore coat protein [Tepidibacillus fermentans]